MSLCRPLMPPRQPDNTTHRPGRCMLYPESISTRASFWPSHHEDLWEKGGEIGKFPLTDGGINRHPCSSRAEPIVRVGVAALS